MAPYGTWARNGVDIALSDINSPANQSAPLHVLRRDARSDPRRALAAAEELISEGVQALIVATSSGTVLGIAPLCQRRQVVLFSPTVSSPSISSAGEFIFRNRISWAVESAAMGFYAADTLGFRAVGLAVSDNEAGALCETAFRQAFEADGGRVVRTVPTQARPNELPNPSRGTQRRPRLGSSVSCLGRPRPRKRLVDSACGRDRLSSPMAGSHDHVWI